MDSDDVPAGDPGCGHGGGHALAIILALRSPELALKGILTVSGNVHVSQATANTLTVLDFLDAPLIPVATGAAAPLARPGITAGDVHGGDGLGGVAGRFPSSRRAVTEDAAGFLLEAISRQPEQLTLIATAPLTNIALAIEKDVQTMRKLRALFVMGGAVRVLGNVGPVSEFNFVVDPEAAAIVLGRHQNFWRDRRTTDRLYGQQCLLFRQDNCHRQIYPTVLAKAHLRLDGLTAIGTIDLSAHR